MLLLCLHTVLFRQSPALCMQDWLHATQSNDSVPSPASRSILWGRPWVCRAVRCTAARCSPSAAAGHCVSAHIPHIPSDSSPPRCSHCLMPWWPLELTSDLQGKYTFYSSRDSHKQLRRWLKETSVKIYYVKSCSTCSNLVVNCRTINIVNLCKS